MIAKSQGICSSAPMLIIGRSKSGLVVEDWLGSKNHHWGNLKLIPNAIVSLKFVSALNFIFNFSLQQNLLSFLPFYFLLSIFYTIYLTSCSYNIYRLPLFSNQIFYTFNFLLPIGGVPQHKMAQDCPCSKYPDKLLVTIVAQDCNNWATIMYISFEIEHLVMS